MTSWALWTIEAIVAVLLVQWLLGVRYIPHDRVGLVEKLWSRHGSLTGGGIVALAGEAGFQSEILRGGLHWRYYPGQYRILRVPLVTVSEGRIGYVYARDGAPLPPTQTLGHNIPCNHFQDTRAFLTGGGQRGRQRAILREGVFAVNLAQFVVITEQRVFSGPILDGHEKYADWQRELSAMDGFRPVVVGQGGHSAPAQAEAAPHASSAVSPADTIGVVTVHDGPPIASGEIIAPEVRPAAAGERDHEYFQDPETFLALGGCRGKQLQVLTDGTFFLNRWFATVEAHGKTLIPIGYVGVIVSYFGNRGADVTGEQFRYGEQVESGERGVWKRALPPGKYPLNPYALKVELVPTVNFVLRWVTGQVEAHQYDRDLTSIDLITADGYEPVLPLSLVLHIDYEKAPSVVQRFGDVRRLISQTLDPILTSYFRDVAQSSHMLDLLAKREDIQHRATQELGRRFQNYDITCVAVLIGRPESKPEEPGREASIERLFDQLRQRRLAEEQKATFAKQQEAAAQLQQLNDAEASARKQAELTQTKIDVEIAANRGDAQLAESRRLARRDVARAFGEASRVTQVGRAEAAVLLQKVQAYGDSRLFALNLMADRFADSDQPIVPERLFVMGGDGNGAGPGSSANVFNQLVALLLAEKSGLGVAAPAGVPVAPAATDVDGACAGLDAEIDRA